MIRPFSSIDAIVGSSPARSIFLLIFTFPKVQTFVIDTALSSVIKAAKYKDVTDLSSFTEQRKNSLYTNEGMYDGGAMFDSRVIAEYIDTLSPVGKLIPATGRERAAVKTWEALADGVVDAGILVRLENTFRNPSEQSAKWLDRQMDKVHHGFETMAGGLGDAKWCHGNQFSLADISVGCTLGWFELRFGYLDWKTQYPNLRGLYERLSERPSFVQTVPPAA